MTILQTREPAPVPAEEPRSAVRRDWHVSAPTLIFGFVGIILAYLIVGPLFILISGSAQDTSVALPLTSGSKWSWVNYRAVFTSSDTWHVMLTTIEYALGSLIVAGVLAVACAWLIERTDIPLRRLLYVLVVAGAGIPGLVFAICWDLLLNPQNGIVNQALNTMFGFKFNALSLSGMIFVEGIRMVPITFLLVSGTFRSMNGSLEDAAAMSGAPLHTTLRRVTLPLLAPALLAALIYNFVSVLEELDVPLVLGLRGHVNVLSTEVYLSVNPAGGLPNFGLASTYGLLLMVLSIIPLIIYRRLMKRVGSFATTTGRGYQSRRLALGKWRYPALAIFLVYIFITFILPLLVMLFASVEPYFSGVSWAAFHRMTLSGWTAELHSSTLVNTIFNTLKICLLVALFVMLFSFVASWLIVRSRRGSATLDFWVFFPHLIPAVVMGLAIALVYLVLPVGIYDTIWIIVIALCTKFIALGTRITTPGIAQIGTTLEEAVAASGGGLRHVWGRVLLPLLRPVLTNGFVLVFVVAAQSLTLPLLLAAPGSEVLATSIWGYWQLGHVVPAMVESTLLTVITVILATAMRSGDANQAGKRKSRRQARRTTVAVNSTPSMSTVAVTSPEFAPEPERGTT